MKENLKREILIQILRNGYRALNLIKSFSQHRLCILWLKINRDWRFIVQKIDFSPNRINLPKFMATQLVVILFMIVFTYKWAFMFTTIHEQTFLANLLYGILGFIVILGLHELIHRISFLFFKREQPHFKYKRFS